MSDDAAAGHPPPFAPGEALVAQHPWLAGALLNLAGDYRYLGDGYYRSLEAELAGERVHPTTSEALDAYVVPLALARGRNAGLAVAEHQLVLDGAPVPSLLYPVNPFSRRAARIDRPETLLATLGAATRVGKYLALCQPLEGGERLTTLRCLLGHSGAPDGAAEDDDGVSPSVFTGWAQALFDAFRLPLMRAQLLLGGDGPPRLSAIDPLPWRELGTEERSLIEGLGTWRS